MPNPKKTENSDSHLSEQGVQDKFLRLRKDLILNGTSELLQKVKSDFTQESSFGEASKKEQNIEKTVSKTKETVSEFVYIDDLPSFLQQEKMNVQDVLDINPEVPITELASMNAEFREHLLNFLFAGENRQITIDDDFNHVTEKVLDSAITWLDSLGCTPEEKTKWLREMFTFFIIGDSLLDRQKITELGKKYDIDYASFFMKQQNGDKRENYESFLMALFVDNDVKKGVKPRFMDMSKTKILKQLLEKGVPLSIFQFHTPLGHPRSTNESAHVQYSSHPQLEVDAFNSIMNTVLRQAGIDINYQTDQIRTTGGGGMKGWRGFEKGSALEKLGIPPVWWSGDFDSSTIKGLQQHWKTNTEKAEKIMPLIHSQGLAKSITPAYFSGLTNSFFPGHTEEQIRSRNDIEEEWQPSEAEENLFQEYQEEPTKPEKKEKEEDDDSGWWW